MEVILVNDIGKKIRLRREYLEMTQEDLAKKLGYKSKSTINKIEMGINDISQKKIIAFANALNTTPAYLMGWLDSPINIKSTTKFSDILKICKESDIQISDLLQEEIIPEDYNNKNLCLYEVQMNAAKRKGIDTDKLNDNDDRINNKLMQLLASKNNLIEERSQQELNSKDQKEITKILSDTEALLNQEGLMFDGEPASEESISSIISAMKIGMEMAKKNNKKYTPNKYKKD